ncbi:MAG TPA: hypothetical protein VEI03_08490 [Stellaceae bacterium]|nr:hypothetical protein [Stellaceae bacterium]
MVDFRDRVAAALRARISPKGGVAIKKLANGIGRSAETIRLWLNGDTAIKVEDLAAVARYLKDPTLVAEIFRDLDAATVRKRFLWFTDRGFCNDAPAGHAEFVRRHLGLSPLLPGDGAVYALRNLGWVELTASGTAARLRYHAKGIKRGAAQAARGWLLDHADRIFSLSRAVFVGFEWAEAAELSVARIVAELDLAAPPSAVPLCRSERKPLDLLPSRLGEVLRAWRHAPDDAEAAAHAVRLGGRFSIFAADDAGSVICHRLGQIMRMPRRECEGANLLTWSDPPYAAELRRAVLEAREDGPTHREVRGPIFGPPRHFNRLALPVGDNIVTVTELRRN